TDTAISYQWFFGDPGSGPNDSSQQINPSHIYTASGTYLTMLVATNVWGCSDTITLACVTIPTVPDAELSANVQQLTTIDPTSIFSNNTSNAINYCVYFGDGDSLCTNSMGPYTHTYDSIGTFTVMLIAWSVAGCPDTTWLTILVEEPTTCFIPNAFTPDGSGLNDLFMVSGINVREFELLIFDRWGMLIFSTTDPYHGWDGTFKGNKCQEDVYVWRLKYCDTYGIRTEKMGHVSLIR
ncbi:MAG TPA: PKD domain-containing protein, partial [Bacteroidia bacterium]|nr:PKD domain-containing protein [Bacteroidia bacterium]